MGRVPVRSFAKRRVAAGTGANVGPPVRERIIAAAGFTEHALCRPRGVSYERGSTRRWRARSSSVLCSLLLGSCLLAPSTPAHAQFVDEFEEPAVRLDPKGVDGWSFRTGDGQATMDLRQGGTGHASIFVDATKDRRNIWWALIKRRVSDRLELKLLAQPAYEVRVEARIRVSHAPRRVNLHVNTQRTTDFHSHLMEFDIPDTERWHTIGFTTRQFDAGVGDTVFAQLALIDWGLGTYRVDVDSFKVDVVDAARAGPDAGAPVPYHPPVPAASESRHQALVAEDATIDLEHADVNLNNWYVREGAITKHLLTVNGTQWVILRFDMGAFAGKQVAGHGLLELTTHSVQRTSDAIKDFGMVRIAEILGGDRHWNQRTVTADSLRAGQPIEAVVNTQMIIDWPVTEGEGGKTYFTISRPVLQRLIDGRTLGLAIKPLGAISASVYAMENRDARLHARLLLNVR